MDKKSNIVSFDDALRRARENARTRDGAGVRSAKKRPLGRAAIIDSSEFFKNEKAEEPDSREKSRADKSKKRASKMSERISNKRDAKKRERNKAKAERKFEKTYGGSGGSSRSRKNSKGAAAPEGGPRAAVYKGEMGSRAKKASRIQEKASVMAGAASGLAGKSRRRDRSNGDHAAKDRFPKPLRVCITTLACLLIFGFALYSPAQECYKQMRQRDRIAAEYAAVQARNDELASVVHTLQTDEGIADKAHSEFGLVKRNENAVSVTGIEVVDRSKFTASVVPGSVPAPNTWYTPILDTVFGYDNT